MLHAGFEGPRRRQACSELPTWSSRFKDRRNVHLRFSGPAAEAAGTPAPARGVAGRGGCADSEPGMPSAETLGAICVQRFDGSRNSAIHTTYRSLLRSSSIQEPRYPLLRVVIGFGATAEPNAVALEEAEFGVGGRKKRPNREARSATRPTTYVEGRAAQQAAAAACRGYAWLPEWVR